MWERINKRVVRGNLGGNVHVWRIGGSGSGGEDGGRSALRAPAKPWLLKRKTRVCDG